MNNSEYLNPNTSSEDQLRQLHVLLDSLSVPIAYIDSLERYQYTNKVYHQWWGCDAPEKSNLTLKDLLRPEVYEEVQPKIKAALAGEIVTFEYKCNYAKAGVKYVQVSYRPHFSVSGTVEGVFILVIDLTRRRVAEKILENTEARLRKVVEKAKVIPWEADAATWNFTYVGPQAVHSLGYPIEYWYEDSFWQNHIHPEDRKAAIDFCLEQSMAAAEHDFEYRMVAADGSYVWYHDFVSVHIEESGRKTLHGFLIDITERKQVEQEKHELEGQLQQSQKMEALGTLAGGISHDFNNILSVILGYTEMASNQVESDSPLKGYLKQAYSSALQAKDLVGQILAFSQRAKLDREVINFATLLTEATNLLRAIIPASIRIEEKFNLLKPFYVMGNASQLHQVVLNLCTNAEHAMRGQGGVLTIELAQSENSVRLIVKDTGSGITSDVIERMFEPYYTTKAVGEGTGLGLSVVHGIIASHGGRILVASEPQLGTTVTCDLPRVAPSLLANEEPPANFKVNGERVLFIDDEKSLAILGSEILESLGYQVVSFTSAVEALLTFQEDPTAFDLVVTDQTMPDISGNQLIGKIQALREDIPAILCTGYSSTVDQAKARELGFVGFVMKPYSLRDLEQAVGAALQTEITQIKAVANYSSSSS